jgi:hypothetical protein
LYQEGNALKESKIKFRGQAIIIHLLLIFLQKANTPYQLYLTPRSEHLAVPQEKLWELDAKVIFEIYSSWSGKLYSTELIWVLCEQKRIRKAILSEKITFKY